MSHAPLEVANRVRDGGRRQSSTSMRVWARCAKDKRRASVITWLELQTSRLGNRQSGAIYARFPGSAVYMRGHGQRLLLKIITRTQANGSKVWAFNINKVDQDQGNFSLFMRSWLPVVVIEKNLV